MILPFSPTGRRDLDQAVLTLGEIESSNLMGNLPDAQSVALSFLKGECADTLVASWKRWFALEQMTFLVDIAVLLLPLVAFKLLLDPTANVATAVGLVWASVCLIALLAHRRFLHALHYGPRVAFARLSGNAATAFVASRVLEDRGGHSNWRYWSVFYYTHLTRMLNEARDGKVALDDTALNLLTRLREAISKKSKVFGEPPELQAKLIEAMRFHLDDRSELGPTHERSLG